MALLAQHAPNLQSLWCTLTLTVNEQLTLPAKITSLILQLRDDYADAAIEAVLATVASLPSLSLLHLQLSAFEATCSVQLRLLAACRSLTDLTLETAFGSAPILSIAQLDQIRSSLGLLTRFFIGWKGSVLLACLLQSPVTAQWQDIGEVEGDAHTGELLLTLPGLTKLDLRYVEAAAHADFLQHLPRLTMLKLDCYRNERAWDIPSDALLASLVRCAGLIELDLCCGFDSAHWSALFAKLTIKKLTIRYGELKSLQCFATGPITQSLEELTLCDLALPPSEISHLYGLRRLRTLKLYDCFAPPLDDASLACLFPPTPILPALTKLVHHLRYGECIDRQGPSFEWMQQRLTQ